MQQQTEVAEVGCCGVPDNVSPQVKRARGSVVAVIVFHGIALLAFGFASWYTWLGSMVAFIMGGVHLCMFTKCTYITAGCLYIVGFFFDLTAVADWVTMIDDNNEGIWGDLDWQGLAWFSVPVAVAALCYFIAICNTFMAVAKWDESGAPDVARKGTPAPGHTV